MADSDYSKNQFTRPGGLYTASVSAVSPASGVLDPAPSGATPSGPWLVETQWLHIDYARVPKTGLAVSTMDITLASASLTYRPTQSTQLVGIVQANYSRGIDYTNYNTSSYQQPQVFDILAVSADANGVSYGTAAHWASAGGTSALGPMGSIVTVQPFYRRTPYNNETLTTSTAAVATFSISVASGATYDQADYLTDYAFWKDNGCRAGTQRNDWWGRAAKHMNYYGFLVGPYMYTQEFPINISNFIDQVGMNLTNNQMWPMPNSLPTVSVYGSKTGLAEYDISRHQY